MKNLEQIIAAAQKEIEKEFYAQHLAKELDFDEVQDFLATSIRKAVEESFKAISVQPYNPDAEKDQKKSKLPYSVITEAVGYNAALRAVEKKKKELLK